jgi:hypothetical protein
MPLEDCLPEYPILRRQNRAARLGDPAKDVFIYNKSAPDRSAYRNLGRRRGEWPGRELNPRHADFQSAALPTELPGRWGGKYRKRLNLGQVTGSVLELRIAAPGRKFVALTLKFVALALKDVATGS